MTNVGSEGINMVEADTLIVFVRKLNWISAVLMPLL
jgi:hypothetical protein